VTSFSRLSTSLTLGGSAPCAPATTNRAASVFVRRPQRDPAVSIDSWHQSTPPVLRETGSTAIDPVGD
jgi:hypothetical protein